MTAIAADTALGHLQAALSHAGLDTEVIGEYPTGDLVNVGRDGVYLYTLSVSRTDGYGEFPTGTTTAAA